jgi:hypothetical protein
VAPKRLADRARLGSIGQSAGKAPDERGAVILRPSHFQPVHLPASGLLLSAAFIVRLRAMKTASANAIICSIICC